MNDLCRYHVHIVGPVDEHEVNSTSPLEMKLEKVEADSTWLSVRTDQSGLIGLVRHLHGLGFVLLRVDREE